MYESDRQYPGLKRRIRGSGHETWVYVYSFRGRDRCFTIGQVTTSQARRIAARLQHEVAEGRDPQAEKLAQREAGTFGELYARYVEEWAKRRNKSWAQADYLVRSHLLPRWAKLDAKSITRANVRAVIGKIESPTVANQTLAAASAVFTFAIRMEVIPHNPCKGIERNPTQSRERVLSDSEIQLFWPELTAPLKLILLCGQRPGEVQRMLRQHIKDGWWEMPGAADPKTGWPGTKNKESHRVWLVEPVREIIAASSVGDSGFVFNRGHLDAAMRGICAKLGVADRVTPHDLRRSWATRAAELGVTRLVVDRVLNHADRSVTGGVYDRYAYGPEIQRAMERVAARVLALAEGRAAGGADIVLGVFSSKA